MLFKRAQPRQAEPPDKYPGANLCENSYLFNSILRNRDGGWWLISSQKPGDYRPEEADPNHPHCSQTMGVFFCWLEDGNILDGKLPPKQLKMVQAWIEIHKEELFVDWALAVNGDEPFRIAPLQ